MVPPAGGEVFGGGSEEEGMPEAEDDARGQGLLIIWVGPALRT